MKILPALIISLIMLHSTQATAADDVVGKIVLKKGLTEKSNLNCQGSECDNMIIRRGDRIRTGRDSKVQVMLTDGTGIIIYERSDIIFNYVINPGRKKP
ncbi:MAG: FecR domain-containing protein, partial [Spirochaetes bacterium]|nr:FecR domain-containing protein [Spirochaetota bacterium]